MCVNWSFSSCLRELLLCTCSQCPSSQQCPPTSWERAWPPNQQPPWALRKSLARAWLCACLISPDNFVVFLSSTLAPAVYSPLSTCLFSSICTCLFSFQKQNVCLEISVRVTWSLTACFTCHSQLRYQNSSVCSGCAFRRLGPCVVLATWQYLMARQPVVIHNPMLAQFGITKYRD